MIDPTSTAAPSEPAQPNPAPTPDQVPDPNQKFPSGVGGILNGHVAGQGFIDLCREKGWDLETDENWTTLPGSSIAVASGGLLVWSPATGPRAVSFD